MNLLASPQPAALPRASLLRHPEVSSDQRKAMKEENALRARSTRVQALLAALVQKPQVLKTLLPIRNKVME